MTYDLVVIGSGPAGLSASIKLSEAGAKVVVVDENPVAGGKLLGQLHEEPTGWWIGQQIAQNLFKKAIDTGVTFLQQREVWGIHPKWRVLLNTGEELQTRYILLATGAAEQAIPVPGWTLPGVMAIGAAQVMNNYYRVRPGKRIAIIGTDPLALTVANELRIAGSEVVGIYLPPANDFSEEKANPKFVLSNLSNMSDLAPNKMLKIAGRLIKNKFLLNIGAHFFPKNGMKVWGIPLLLRQSVQEICGTGQVEHISVASVDAFGRFESGSTRSVDVDCVCISGGLYPLSELASSIGCIFTYIEELGGHVPLHSPEMESSQDGVYVAGNITGIESARIAMAQGECAGVSIALRLGLITSDADRLIQQARFNIDKARKNTIIKFQPHIELGRKKLADQWKNYQNEAIQNHRQYI